MSRVWCVEHQTNHTMTALDQERAIYAYDWMRADLLVNPQLHAINRRELEDADQLDQLKCPAAVLLLTNGDPTDPLVEHVDDCVERRIRHDQAERAAGRTPR